ncbi:uncharacterized protein BCR38DRAFT_335408 [Pseudomassariella vexata]|uniref:Uncharacterized protein n=1 Tax=Pseudomassariella vexata TaxID=1141098 RepID=A0A1Y2EAK6_9PEZI|nr:uncharacterized protein BCR38DRAFT_335408 [Pseudomassariella vexata]ORY68620.1 hypothetical protein BCR38DRAFT_335408 [Pseudomassariella vexata]
MVHAAGGRSQANLLYPTSSPLASLEVPTRKMRKGKRKADSQDNERLSKRLSLLNLEHNGQKLYVPVESPQLKPAPPSALKHIPEEDSMQLDDSKHKVYIYDLDAELSDSGESDDGRLVFLPDIEKHLRETRIPPSILANKDGELAGMQVVLYSEPTSLTIPEDKDSVRRAIIEARARARRKQLGEPELPTQGEQADASSQMDLEMPSSSTMTQLRNFTGLSNLANEPIETNHVVGNCDTWPPAMAHGPQPEPEPEPMDMDMDIDLD